MSMVAGSQLRNLIIVAESHNLFIIDVTGERVSMLVYVCAIQSQFCLKVPQFWYYVYIYNVDLRCRCT